ncbi:MAG: transglycosylase domain-containing protein [Clostridia bacterium]|nr:transglycosylase domain-containing protein [Clostridia bacterium]
MEKILNFFKRIDPRNRSGFVRAVDSMTYGFSVTAKILVSILFVILFTGVICVGVFGIYVKNYLQPDASIDIASISMNYTSVVYYTDPETGEQVELERLYGAENRVWANYDVIPKHLKNAFIAIEDERFMSHKGVDWKRTVAATVNLVLPYSSGFGGSTITQQLVKNITGDDEVTVQRKVLEILRALDLERKLSKEEILEMYLNTINLSQGCYGVSSASYVYFGKNVSELSLAECACIAGITNSPTYYDPFQNPDNNKERQELILGKMLELGSISREEYEQAMSEPLRFRNPDEDDESDSSGVQSYFTDLLINELIEDFKNELGYSSTMAYKLLYAGGLEIEATVDPKVQSALEEVYENRENFPRVKGTTQLESAMVIMSSDGYLRGIVGGIGQKSGNLVLNRALAERQPGSAIKPLSVYAPALEYGLITPNSVVDDSPSKYIATNGALVEGESVILLNDSTITTWPSNSDNKYRGLMTVTEAMERSTNTVPVRILDMMTLDTAFDFASERFGLSLIRDEIRNEVFCTDLTYSALALGGLSYGVSLLEMTAAYVPFVNDGVYSEATTYTRVFDADGNLLLDNTDRDSIAISAETAYYTTQMLTSAVENGTGAAAAIDGIAVGGKTGTTSSDYDRWFMGVTPYYVGGVWVGFDRNKTIGLDYNPAVTIWHDVMEKLHEDLPDADFEARSDLVTCSYCLDSGGIPTESCKNDPRGSRIATGEFFETDAPTTLCTAHIDVKLCPDTGKICTDFCNRSEADIAVRLNLYRYFAVPNVSIEDEGYCVHFDGVLSDRILTYYFPATAPEGRAMEGACYLHLAPTTTRATSTGIQTTRAPKNTPKVMTVITTTTEETTETTTLPEPPPSGVTGSSGTVPGGGSTVPGGAGGMTEPPPA